MAATNNDASQEAGVAMPATPPRENLYRATRDIGIDRAAQGMPTMKGHFAVWDTWTEIRSAYEGNFMERFAPGSMVKTLSERTPKVLFQHGKDPQIGDKVLGIAARVEPDKVGAYYEVPLFDTSYNRDLIPGLKADAYGASFRFSVMQEEVVQRPPRSEHNPRGITERTVTEAKVMEFGPVTFGAYEAATSGIRSMTDEFLADTLLMDEEMLERLAERIAKKSRSFSVSVPRMVFDSSKVGFSADAEILDEIVEPEPEVRDEEPLVPEPSEATTPTEPEPPAATTRAHNGPKVPLYPNNREEKPTWLL